jgi:hypothetical protein
VARPIPRGLKVPGELAFSEFRGYEDWAIVAVHHTEDLITVVVANPVMIACHTIVKARDSVFTECAKR